MLDEERPERISRFSGFVSVEFGFMSTDYSFIYNDEVSPLVLAYQFFLMFSVVCKLAIKSHFIMLAPWSLVRQERTKTLTACGHSIPPKSPELCPIPNAGNMAGMTTTRAKKAIVILMLMLLVPALFGKEPVFAQDKQMTLTEKIAEKIKRFRLFTNCEPVYLVVEGLGQSAAGIGLTESDIIAAAESRLRSARIYTAEAGDSYLYVNVNVTKRAYSISIKFKKMVLDLFSGHNSFATTWDVGEVGTHGGSSGYILFGIARYMDEFLVQFLRVNEKACERKREP